jgi:tripeptide aminopeptidase
MTSIVDQFIELVTIDSPSGKEEHIAEYLKKWLINHDFSVKQDGLGSIIACPNHIKPTQILCAHMDTVEPGCGIKPVITKTHIQSDGTTILGADNKAALAAILCAVEKHIATYHHNPAVELLFTVKEETGGGVNNFPFDWILSKNGLIFDYAAPIGKIILDAPFITNFSVTYTGKSAHASKPEEGINALIPAIKFLQQLPVGKMDSGDTTINIGLVESGSGINVVPEQTTICGEVRSQNQEIYQKYIEKIKIMAKTVTHNTHVHCSVNLDGYCPGYSISPTDSFLKKTVRRLKRFNITPTFEASTSVSDANILNANGFKMINMSDGVENPHTLNEKISLSNLDKLTSMIYIFLAEI